MKYIYLTFFIGLLFLAGCTPKDMQPEIRTFTLDDILSEFDRLDAKHNTSWRSEVIPAHMISPRELPEMKIQLEALRTEALATSNDSIPLQLINARLDMIETQGTYYLGATIPTQFKFAISGNNLNITLNQSIPCDRAIDVVRSARLYEETLKHFFSFMYNMDTILQSSQEARQKIGVDKNRPAFYNSGFSGGREKLNAIKKALEDQCGITFEFSQETKQALQYAEQES